MTHKEFEFTLLTKDITPPLPGGVKFEAKLYVIYDHREKRWIVQAGDAAPTPLGSPFYGKTREEAESKAADNTMKWIDSQR